LCWPNRTLRACAANTCGYSQARLRVTEKGQVQHIKLQKQGLQDEGNSFLIRLVGLFKLLLLRHALHCTA
jgi:hypothetical protein